MLQVFERLWVGNEQSCRAGAADWSVVHACKSPCHQHAVGYRGSLQNTHPNYLSLRRDHDLFLNMIDPSRPMFMPPTFTAFLAFAEQEWTAGQNMLIHCNLGESRAPSLALLFLAKRRGILADASYAAARTGFEALYPVYRPGQGIQAYFAEKWSELGAGA